MEFVILVICALCVTPVTRGTNYEEKYFDQKMDHFDFLTYGNQTFKQRYLYNDTFWNRGVGPILFYAGNEDDITVFGNNIGCLYEIAQQLSGLILFAEHRFYGKSFPCGIENPTKCIGLLNIVQALADYAFLIEQLKSDLGAENCPVIAFGGSYGGVLAAFIRFKYPNVVDGAISSSAPLYTISGTMPGEIYFRMATNVFHKALPRCERRVRQAFAQIKRLANQHGPGLQAISERFQLCNPLISPGDMDHFYRWVRQAFVLAAMFDYPYPTEFLSSLPGNPVKVMCQKLVSRTPAITGIIEAINVVYNSSEKSLPCHNIWKELLTCAGCGFGPRSKSWDYQSCTDLNLEADSDGIHDMFPPLPFNSSMRDEYCWKTWKVVPRRNWMKILFWIKDFSTASNIVFTNGNLDPVTAGGVLHTISDTLVAMMVDGGAHHFDLRGSHPADPPSVKRVRRAQIEIIKGWIKDAKLKRSRRN